MGGVAKTVCRRPTLTWPAAGRTMKSRKPQPAHDPEVLTVDEAAALLRVNRKTLYEAIRSGAIPGVRRIGRAIRVHRETMLRWMGHGRVIADKGDRR